MSKKRTSPWRKAALLALSALMVVPASVAAQFTPRGARAAPPRPDFLFGRPHVTLSIRGGYAVPTETPGNIYGQLGADQALILYRDNFNSASISGELAIRATDRVDIVVDMGYAGGKIGSEYRNWEDDNNLPIQQNTTFTRTPLTFGVKGYLWSPGRSIGQLAWIPKKWTPFVGASAGWVWYRFRQTGDFIDFLTNDVYSDRYESSGRTATVHLFGGADWTISPRLALTAEGRYSWAKAPMGQDFVGFEDLKLSGFQASAGISLRF